MSFGILSGSPPAVVAAHWQQLKDLFATHTWTWTERLDEALPHIIATAATRLGSVQVWQKQNSNRQGCDDTKRNYVNGQPLPTNVTV